ncbi:MAG: pro-sigmaK processing inhibitor BofA family protein [Candidatus Methanogasteraceae archaeon]|nr:pro-sigmaK processing inhibitor BofA family protein [Euryarchaeota archaeon]
MLNLVTMTAIPELLVLVLAIFAAVILYKILKTVKKMLINTIIGLIVLVLANVVLDLEIAYDWVVILICAVAGTVGAIFVIVLHCMGIAF